MIDSNKNGKRPFGSALHEVLKSLDREISFYRKRASQVFFLGLFVTVLIVAGKEKVYLPGAYDALHPYFETGLFIAVAAIGILLGAEYRSRIHILKEARMSLLQELGFSKPVYPTAEVQRLSEIRVLYVVLGFTASCGILWSWLSPTEGSPWNPGWVQVLGRATGIVGIIISAGLLFVFRYRHEKVERTDIAGAAGPRPGEKTLTREAMPQYLVAIHHPDNYNSSLEDEAMVRDIDVLNEEMEAAGARFFAGGLQAAHHAKSLRKQPGGEVVIIHGPYLETKEHIGGFWILNAADMDEAVAWGRKAAVACRASVEVREFLAMPTK